MISAGGGENASWLSIVGTGTPTICEGRADAQESGCAMGQAFAGASVSLTEQITRSVASVLMARETTVYTEESEQKKTQLSYVVGPPWALCLFFVTMCVALLFGLV